MTYVLLYIYYYYMTCIYDISAPTHNYTNNIVQNILCKIYCAK